MTDLFCSVIYCLSSFFPLFHLLTDPIPVSLVLGFIANQLLDVDAINITQVCWVFKLSRKNLPQLLFQLFQLSRFVINSLLV